MKSRTPQRKIELLIILASVSLLSVFGLTVRMLSLRFFDTRPRYMWFETKSPDNRIVVFVEYEEPVWTYSAHTIIVFYKCGQKHQYLFDTELHNDGATLNVNNYTIEYSNNTLHLTLKGEKQKDVTYKIIFYPEVTFELL